MKAARDDIPFYPTIGVALLNLRSSANTLFTRGSLLEGILVRTESSRKLILSNRAYTYPIHANRIGARGQNCRSYALSSVEPPNATEANSNSAHISNGTALGLNAAGNRLNKKSTTTTMLGAMKKYVDSRCGVKENGYENSRRPTLAAHFAA